MRAITLWQPWASLMAEGVKTIETRGRAHPWHSAIGETIAIHAAKRGPDVTTMMRLSADDRLLLPGAERFHGSPLKFLYDDVWYYQRLDADGRPIFRMPLGAALATGRLADVVPMVDFMTEREDTRKRIEKIEGSVDATLWLRVPREVPATNITEQLPYGSFEPGRFALLFEDVVKLNEPCPAVGHQGLWTVPAGLVRQAK